MRLQNLQSGEWIFAAGVQQENSDYDCTFGMAVPNTYNFLCWWWAYYITSGFGKRGRIEERFLVEWRHAQDQSQDHRDDSVWYDILAFSKPNRWLARIGYPVARQFQKRFARDSKQAMVRLS